MNPFFVQPIWAHQTNSCDMIRADLFMWEMAWRTKGSEQGVSWM